MHFTTLALLGVCIDDLDLETEKHSFSILVAIF